VTTTIETICGYQLDPVVYLFPEITDEEIDALAADIKAHGQLEPCIYWQGKVVDGRNRLLACERAGVTPMVADWPHHDTGFDPLAYAISKNLHRRHLTAGQRAEIAAEAARLYEERAAERERATQAAPGERIGGEKHVKRVKAAKACPHSDMPTGARAIDTAAAMVGASRTSAYEAAAVLREAPDVAKRLKSGAISLRQATAEVKARKSPEGASTPGEAPSPSAQQQDAWKGLCVSVERLYQSLTAADLTRGDLAATARQLVAVGWPVTPHRGTFGPVARSVASAMAAVADAVGDRT